MRLARLFALISFILFSFCPAESQNTQNDQKGTSPPASQASNRETEIDAAFEAGIAAATKGKAIVPLLAQGTIALPEGYLFIPQKESARILQAMGNSPGSDLIGTIFHMDEDWFATISFIKSGYIKDDEAKNWNIDELLQNLRDGTEEDNKTRVAKGFAPLKIAGWIEKPIYNSQDHRLVWSILVTRIEDSGKASVNYNTYALGRDGYFTLNLVSNQADIERNKPHAKTLLNSIDFSLGKRYDEFIPGKDHVAEYGIAALVAGGVAKKLGILGVVAAFAAKFAKVFVIAGIGLVAAIGKFFKRKKNDQIT